MSTLLEFEEPLADLLDQLAKAKEIQGKGEVDVSKTIKEIEQKIGDKRKKIFAKLTPWQRVQLSRHLDRPYTLDYIRAFTGNSFVELHGDRNVRDDKAIVGGLGMMDGKTVMFIGHQKGNNTKLRQYRNFGMANPEGYRKALRLMKLAEKFNKPVVTLIDTPGAYPGLEAEERGQGEAIARNIYEMVQLKVPVLVVIIGEGASGGALGIGIGDKVFMLEHTWYSVISPESCSSILWRNWDSKEQAAEALKLTSEDMLKNKLVDGVVKEPIGGAHTNWQLMFDTLKGTIQKELVKLEGMDPKARVEKRIKKISKIGLLKEEYPAL